MTLNRSWYQVLRTIPRAAKANTAMVLRHGLISIFLHTSIGGVNILRGCGSGCVCPEYETTSALVVE
jgi:hypothetical protein